MLLRLEPHTDHAIPKFSRAGKRVRTAAGAANDQEALETERICHSANVVRGMAHLTSWKSRGLSVARPIECDHVKAQTGPQRRVGMSVQPAARRAVEEEHRSPVQITPLLIGNGPAIFK